MIIKSLEIFKVAIPLYRPFKTALRTVEACEDIIVRLNLEDGQFGFGSAAPALAITGESHETIISAIKNYIAPSLVGVDIAHRHLVSALLRSAIAKNTSAKAAVDMAVFDAWSKIYKLPLVTALGGKPKVLTTDMTISLNTPKIMLDHAKEAMSQGFDALKIKVGGSISEDLERIKTIVNGTENRLEYRIDANQAWSSDDAIQMCGILADLSFNIPFIEQPVKALDFEGLKKVHKNSPLRILADESCFSFQDALKLIQMDACDLLNVKLMKTGSIDEALQIIDLAYQSGKECMISSMLESKMGIACASAIAAARPEINFLDLDASHMQSKDPFNGGISISGPKITINNEFGHGISYVEGLIGVSD